MANPEGGSDAKCRASLYDVPSNHTWISRFLNQGKPSPYTVNLKHAIPMTDSAGVGDLALLDCSFCVSEILTHTYSTIFPEFSPLFSSYTRICLLSGYRTISGRVQPMQSHLHVPW